MRQEAGDRLARPSFVSHAVRVGELLGREIVGFKTNCPFQHVRQVANCSLVPDGKQALLRWLQEERPTQEQLRLRIRDMVDAERDENTCRKDFALSEAVALGRALEELERPKAKERKAKPGAGRGRPKIASEKLSQANGRTLDKVGAAVGVSRITYQRAKAVVEAAEADPKTFQPLVDEMDRPAPCISARLGRPEPSRRPPGRLRRPGPSCASVGGGKGDRANVAGVGEPCGGVRGGAKPPGSGSRPGGLAYGDRPRRLSPVALRAPVHGQGQGDGQGEAQEHQALRNVGGEESLRRAFSRGWLWSPRA